MLRSPAPEDGAEMLAFLKRCYGETDFLLCYPEEFTQSVEQEAAFLEGILADPDTVMISCVLDGEIVGNCQISFQRQMKISTGPRWPSPSWKSAGAWGSAPPCSTS